MTFDRILADPMQRLVAQVIDVLVGAIPLLLGIFVVAADGPLGAVLAVGGWLWWFVYYYCCDAFNDGQSVGKQLIGLRVVSSADGRTPCSLGQSICRNLLLSVLGPIDWLFIFGERRQRLGDRAAGTIVIDV